MAPAAGVLVSAPQDPSQLQPNGLGKKEHLLWKTTLTVLRNTTRREILHGVHIPLFHHIHMGCDGNDTRLGLPAVAWGSLTQSRKLRKALAAPKRSWSGGDKSYLFCFLVLCYYAETY